MESLAEIFYEEANEMLEAMEQSLLNMEESGASTDTINELFRYAHSLKGNSGAMGFMHVNHFTHALESALDKVRQGKQSLTRPITDLLLQAVDVIRRLVTATRIKGDVGDPECEVILERLKLLMAGDAVGEQPAAIIKPAIITSTGSKAQPVSAGAPIAPINPRVELSTDADLRYYRVCFTPGVQLDSENDPLRTLCELNDMAKVLTCTMQENIPVLEELQADQSFACWDLLLETMAEPVMIKVVLELSASGAQVEIEEITAEEAGSNQEEVICMDAEEELLLEEAVKPNISAAVGIPSTGPARVQAESHTIRVNTEKIDALFNLTSEIVIAQSMLTNSHDRIQDMEARAAVLQMERYVRELHEHVMAIRMIPVGYVFNRFPRLVRDLAASTKKNIHLEMKGEDTELDRTLLESLTDPITHLLRNCIDHGVEAPDEREKAGKPATGVVRLNAYQAEGRIYIEVSDDGRGINVERIRQKGIQQELLREDENPSVEALYDLLFRPGFSTAEKVTDVSGRGVGMDVVKRNVEALGGMVSVQSEMGLGSRFLIKVPLTLAIMDGLNLRVGEEFFIVPLTSVMETFRGDTVKISSAFGAYEMVNVRGKFLPLLRLCNTFKISGDDRDTSECLIIIIEQDGEQVAILADEIIGQHQVVMKSLEANFVRVPGFSGACILGNGQVALIVDVGEIVRQANSLPLTRALVQEVA